MKFHEYIKESDPSLRPPKEWFNKMKKKGTPEAVIGDIWYHKLNDEKRSEIRQRYGKKYGLLKKESSQWGNEPITDIGFLEPGNVVWHYSEDEIESFREEPTSFFTDDRGNLEYCYKITLKLPVEVEYHGQEEVVFTPTNENCDIELYSINEGYYDQNDLKPNRIPKWKRKEKIVNQAIFVESYQKEATNYNLVDALKRTSKFFKNFEDFQKNYTVNIDHGYWWHLTDNPNWKPSKEIAPRDMSSLSYSSVSKGVMVTSDLKGWDEYYNTDPDTDERKNIRTYAVLLDLSYIDPKYRKQVSRGFGNEVFITPDNIDKIKVIQILPIDSALKLSESLQNSIPQSKKELQDIWNTKNESYMREEENYNWATGVNKKAWFNIETSEFNIFESNFDHNDEDFYGDIRDNIRISWNNGMNFVDTMNIPTQKQFDNIQLFIIEHSPYRETTWYIILKKKTYMFDDIKTINNFSYGVNESYQKEAKQVGIIYHFTSLNIFAGFERWLDTVADKRDEKYQLYLKEMQQNKKISFTRNYKLPFGVVRLTVDGNRLSNRYKIKPTADLNAGYGRHHGEDESEEIVIGHRYIDIDDSLVQIDILNTVSGFSFYGKDFTNGKAFVDYLKELGYPYKVNVVDKFKPVKTEYAESYHTEAVQKFDIEKMAKELNEKYFNSEIDINFPIRYGALKRALGTCLGSYSMYKDTKEITRSWVTDLVISNYYPMDEELTRRILCHELIHALLFQRKNPKDNHGKPFMDEVKRIKEMGFPVSISEDLNELDIKIDTERTLKKPVYYVLIKDQKDKPMITFFKNLDQKAWDKLMDTLEYNSYHRKTTYGVYLGRTTASIVHHYVVKSELDIHQKNALKYVRSESELKEAGLEDNFMEFVTVNPNIYGKKLDDDRTSKANA